MARLVECGRPGRARTGGSDTGRAFPLHDRDLLRPRALGANRQQGLAVSVATCPDLASVQRRDRISFAAAGGAANDLWRTGTDPALARLQRGLPATLAHCAGASHVAPTADTITLDAG